MTRVRHERRAAGLCQKCILPLLPGQTSHCVRHWIRHKLRLFVGYNSSFRRGKASHTEDRKRDFVVTALQSRYMAVREGLREPATYEEAQQAAFQLRMDLKLGWGGVGGVNKMANIIMTVEEKAKEIHDAREDDTRSVPPGRYASGGVYKSATDGGEEA